MTTVFQSQRALMVRNLRPGLTEVGKIKIGAKGRAIQSKKGNEFQPPQKLEHFLITTLTRGPDGNFLRDEEMHRRFGDRPTEIPVRLLFDDPWLSFQTVYTAFRGAQRWCTGDGETAERIGDDGALHTVSCPCHRLDPAYDGKDKCKINGTLSVVIDGATVVGGVWKLRTTSINTCQGIASSLFFIMGVTGGKLSGVPLMLVVRPKAATTPQGATTTVYVVGIEFRGTIDQLREYAHQQALADANFGERMKRVEEQARLMLAAPVVSADEDEDVRDEFYPTAAAEARGIRMATPHDPETGEVEMTAEERRAAMEAEEPAAEPERPAMLELWLGPRDRRTCNARTAAITLGKHVKDVDSIAEINALTANNEWIEDVEGELGDRLRTVIDERMRELDPPDAAEPSDAAEPEWSFVPPEEEAETV